MTRPTDADVDFNVVMTDKLDFVELQGSGEEAVFTPDQLTDMLDLAKKGVGELIEAQRKAIHDSDEEADSGQLEDLASHFSK